MTTSFSPIARYDANPHPEAPTVVRPQLAFAPAPRGAAPAPTWRGGWIVSGLAALLAVTALCAVGGVAVEMLTESHPVKEPATTTSAPAVSAPAPVVPAVTAAPAAPAPARVTGTTGTTRIVVVPAAPTAAPAPSAPVVPAAEPVVTAPKPQAPPKGIGTCDLVACDPKPATPPAPPTNCGIVACDPIPQAPPNPLPTCGDLVACQPIPPRTAP